MSEEKILVTENVGEVKENVVSETEINALKKRFDDAQAFINKQAAEIGELRKAVQSKTTEKQVEVEKPVEADKPFFETLKESEKEAVKSFIQKKLSELPEDEREQMKEELSNPDAFNEIAKGIAEKIRKPKYIEDVLGFSKQVKQNTNDEFLRKAKELFGLIDKTVDKKLPSGGQTSQGFNPSITKEKPKKAYPNGGILSLTKT